MYIFVFTAVGFPDSLEASQTLGLPEAEPELSQMDPKMKIILSDPDPAVEVSITKGEKYSPCEVPCILYWFIMKNKNKSSGEKDAEDLLCWYPKFDS